LIKARAQQIVDNLKAKGIRVKFDHDDNARPGWKFAEYEMKGVPIRLAIGARDLENNLIEVARRDTREKETRSLDQIESYVENLLVEIQNQIFNKAKLFRDASITEVNSFAEFEEVLQTKGGFISAHWDGTPETEEKIKELTKATIRCIPLENTLEAGSCVLTGNPSKQRVLFAIAY
jgi:prolyl-tRNA synthetase